MPRTLFHDIDPARVRANLEEVDRRGRRARRGPRRLQVRAGRGDGGAGRGRGARWSARTASRTSPPSTRRYADDFTWDFIGNLQSRKVKQILPLVRLIHSVGTDSVLEQLGRHGTPETEVLIEVNVAEEEGKGGVAPADLADFIARCPVRVSGLMTMPPFAEDPEASRPHFARLAELAAANGLERLSMGTSQDWRVALDEGATIIRLGSALFV